MKNIFTGTIELRGMLSILDDSDIGLIRARRGIFLADSSSVLREKFQKEMISLERISDFYCKFSLGIKRLIRHQEKLALGYPPS